MDKVELVLPGCLFQNRVRPQVQYKGGLRRFILSYWGLSEGLVKSTLRCLAACTGTPKEPRLRVARLPKTTASRFVAHMVHMPVI